MVMVFKMLQPGWPIMGASLKYTKLSLTRSQLLAAISASFLKSSSLQPAQPLQPPGCVGISHAGAAGKNAIHAEGKAGQTIKQAWGEQHQGWRINRSPKATTENTFRYSRRQQSAALKRHLAGVPPKAVTINGMQAPFSRQ
jgi:hypothetical protein